MKHQVNLNKNSSFQITYTNFDGKQCQWGIRNGNVSSMKKLTIEEKSTHIEVKISDGINSRIKKLYGKLPEMKKVS